MTGPIEAQDVCSNDAACSCSLRLKIDQSSLRQQKDVIANDVSLIAFDREVKLSLKECPRLKKEHDLSDQLQIAFHVGTEF